MKAFKLVKTLNSLKAKNKKEGNEQSWTKLLKKTESYKEIFNLFDKVTSRVISSSDALAMHCCCRTKTERYRARKLERQCEHLGFSPV